MENMGKEVYSYNSECLTCNDRPILPIMGEFHFSRYPEGEWKTALKKMQQGGVDIVVRTCFGSTMRKRKVSGISPAEGI